MQGRTRSILLACAVGLSLTACSVQGEGVLRQIRPGDTVFIEGWDEGITSGDEAEVEQKPSKVWVIPIDAPFRRQKDDIFKVEVELTKEGVFVIKNMNGVQVGRDHDDCLASSGEVYAKMAVPEDKLQWEPPDNGGPDGDCNLTEHEQ